MNKKLKTPSKRKLNVKELQNIYCQERTNEKCWEFTCQECLYDSTNLKQFKQWINDVGIK